MELDPVEIWRRVPPEEKFELLARAQSKGVIASFGTTIVCGTIAVGLKLSWLLWVSILITPFIFQYVTGKCWRGLRPKAILEYLAARSAARRYAFSGSGKDLGLVFLFKALLQKVYTEDQVLDKLDDAVERVNEAAVWVALFNDSLVVMTESSTGAEAQLVTVLGDRITIDGESPPGEADYSSRRHVKITLLSKAGVPERRFALTSKYPAALIVFEKRANERIEAVRAEQSKPAAAPEEDYSSLLGDDEDSGSRYGL